MTHSKQKIDKNIDLSFKNNDVWLVKVPKYIAKRWEQAPGNIEVGKLSITQTAEQMSSVSLKLSEGILAMNKDEPEIPKHYRLDISSVHKQTLGVFSVEDTQDEEAARLFMEGQIVQKLECRPYADKCYMNLKKETIRKASLPNRITERLDRIVQCYKPISRHKCNTNYNEKNEKKCRETRNVLLEMLFSAFQKHQYYNLRDLVAITKQPVVYLKQILHEYCIYNYKYPHKNMWQLKPEYCSYSKKEEESDNA